MTPATPTQAAATADTPPIVGARYATTAAILILLICCNARITAPVSLAEQVLGGGPWPTMASLTCLTAALLAGALGFSARDSYRGAHRRLFGILVKSLATLALLLAATRMVAYYLDWNPGLDALQLPRTSAGQSHAATMASATAVGFGLCGICLLLNFKPRFARLCEKLAIGALLCSWIGLTRYLFGVAPMPYFNQMAIETAVCLMLLSTGVLALRANYGLTALFVSPGPAGVSARRLMPAAAIAPLLIGALASYFEHLGALDRGRSAALAAIVSGLVFAGLVWISSAQLQRTDTARAASDARFRSLAESLPQLIWTCNAQGRCDYLSKQWTQYTGIAGASDVDAAWMDRVHPQDSAAVRAAWLGAIDSQTDFTCEFRIRRTDGMYRWFSGRASLQKDEQGRATRWYAAATDIEDQKHAQEALLRSRKMESLGTLAGGIAHDFNNILVAISGNTALALEDLPQQHPARVSLLEVQRAGRRAADLVRRILSFSRMEEPRSEVLHLQPVIEEALKLIRPALPAQIQ